MLSFLKGGKSKSERTYTRADVQRIANTAAKVASGTLLAALRELLDREAKAVARTNHHTYRRLQFVREKLDNLPAIDGVNLNLPE